MGIATYKPDRDPPIVTTNLPKTEPDNYKSIIYSDDNKPLHSLLSYIEGSSWTVDYYSQVVSRDNDLREIDPVEPNISQQYQVIKKLELRVNSPLSQSYDNETGITTVVGTSTIYPFLLPNINDYFITNVGDNKTAIFRITNVDRKSFNRDSVYQVDYEIVGYTDTLQTIYEDLISKVIRTYYFSKDRLVEGLEPILKTEDHNREITLKQEYSKLIKYYFRNFLNKRYGTLVLPGQEYAIYDSFLVTYLFKILDSSVARDLIEVRQIPTDNELFLKQRQFWECMLSKDFDLLAESNTKMKLVNRFVFNRNTYLHGLVYSNIDYIVYPDEPELSILINEYPSSKTVSDTAAIVEVVNRENYLANLLVNTYSANNTTYEDIKLVTHDDYYVLSRDFYDNTDNKSVLEILTKDYMNTHLSSITYNSFNSLLNIPKKFPVSPFRHTQHSS